MKMMNREQALAYGKKTGCKFLVKNTNGGLYGGFVDRADAEREKSRREKEIRENPWCKGENIKVYIEEV
jgi:hypothetical protein